VKSGPFVVCLIEQTFVSDIYRVALYSFSVCPLPDEPVMLLRFQVMAKRRGGDLHDGPLSRKRTADLLRHLRALTKQNRMLKADIEAAACGEAAHGARRKHRRG